METKITNRKITATKVILPLAIRYDIKIKNPRGGEVYGLWTSEQSRVYPLKAGDEISVLSWKKKGWHRDSVRHSLAAKGIKTGRKDKKLVLHNKLGKIKIIYNPKTKEVKTIEGI